MNNYILTDENIDDIMSSALDGGITYWCGSCKVVGKYLGEYASEQISRNGELKLFDYEDDEWYLLTKEKFIKGFSEWYSQGYDYYGAVSDDGAIDTGNIDGPAADCILQFALFGGVIYG